MRVKWILWIAGIGFLVWIHAATNRQIQGWTEGALNSGFGRKAAFRARTLIFPVGIRLSNVTIPSGSGRESSVSIGRVEARINFPALLRGRPGFDLELRGPKFLIERDTAGDFHLPLRPGGVGEGLEFPLAHLKVKEGELLFMDRAVSPLVFWAIRDLSVSVRADPRSGRWLTSGRGLLQGQSHETIGQFEIRGKLDRSALSDAELSVTYQGLGNLAPYLRHVLGTAPSQGAFKLTSAVDLGKGSLSADNRIVATGVLFPTDEPTALGPSGNRLVELLKDRDGMIRLSFPVKGPLGELPDWSNLLGAPLRDAMRRALAQNIQKALADAESPRSVEEALRRSLDSSGR
ncbi:MAG: DUF748 domain-containing protein [Candidatus Omnitrophica bacterium]|nr:DUF748 domain-containing protein [Candidatus Omnitrophota bacterium]